MSELVRNLVRSRRKSGVTEQAKVFEVSHCQAKNTHVLPVIYSSKTLFLVEFELERTSLKAPINWMQLITVQGVI